MVVTEKISACIFAVLAVLGEKLSAEKKKKRNYKVVPP